ncbi:lysylphosphatidylglycerol synthase domain-containing protein [Rhizosaccharibacter radicis]|uniref:Lysylphosphatidylglycerol synthase domain-containing protein n=1 Tax=Rhizosaccharibacter radicis TaxID=2782605 RepID=A0ABT1VW88_9PROT|nr:lysylphosphatidylglycerol synthase domain-containing protein [Acetobacteraceae bacterium KSS12]
MRHAPALLGIGLMAAAIYGVQKEFRHLSLDQIRDALFGIPAASLLLAAGCTLFSYFVLSFYDRLATIDAGHRIGFGRAAFAAFCSYVLSHNLGFSAISGAAVRFRLYGNWGLKPLEITRIIAFCSVTYLLGACSLIGAVLLFEPGSLPMLSQHVPRAVLMAAGAAAWATVGAYLLLSLRFREIRVRGRDISLPRLPMALGQVGVASLEVAATAAIAFALLPSDAAIGFPAFLAIYIASYSAGLFASVPGGLGVFDGAMMLGLSPFMPVPQVIGVILVFRLFYYVIPLFLAGLLFAGHELFLRGDLLLARRRGAEAAPRPRPSGVVRQSEADFAASVGAGAASLCGAMLLALGVFPSVPDLSFALPSDSLFGADPATAPSGLMLYLGVAGDYVPSLIGAALMGLAIGLSQRVTLAWGATMVLLLLAAALTALRGTPLPVPAVLVLTALLLAPFRSSYYRHARVLTEPLSPATVLPLLLLLGCVLVLARTEPHVRALADNDWWTLVMRPGASALTRLTVGLAVLMGLLALVRLVCAGRVATIPWDPDNRQRFGDPGSAEAGRPPPSWRADGMVTGEAGRAAIPFRRLPRLLAGLGDPEGAPADQISAIWRLRDLALQEGRTAVFWRVGPALLDVYGDLGLEAWPLDSRENDPRYLCCPAQQGPALLVLLGREADARDAEVAA